MFLRCLQPGTFKVCKVKRSFSAAGREKIQPPRNPPGSGILEMCLHPALRPMAAHLAGGHVEGPRPQIHALPVIDEGQQQDHAGSLRCPDASQAEDDHSLVGGHDLERESLDQDKSKTLGPMVPGAMGLGATRKGVTPHGEQVATPLLACFPPLPSRQTILRWGR